MLTLFVAFLFVLTVLLLGTMTSNDETQPTTGEATFDTSLEVVMGYVMKYKRNA